VGVGSVGVEEGIVAVAEEDNEVEAEVETVESGTEAAVAVEVAVDTAAEVGTPGSVGAADIHTDPAGAELAAAAVGSGGSKAFVPDPQTRSTPHTDRLQVQNTTAGA
jgi:hypothetical protein